MSLGKPHVYVGTSGWNYSHWKDEVYPEGLRQREWLSYIADHVDAIELNSSFYRIPQVSSLERQQSVTPARLRFAVKMWRGITHYRKLRNAADLLERFFDAVDHLAGPRRGPVLVQLPPQHRDVARLDAFLQEARAADSRRWKIAVEFRHDSWLSPDVYRVLDRHGAALCLHDRAGQGAAKEPNDVGFVYVRRHGPEGGRYRGGYSHAALQGDARNIGRWLEKEKEVYIFFNNDIGGHAFRDAVALRRLLRKSPARET